MKKTENALVIEEGPTLAGYQYRNVALRVPGVYADNSLALQLVQCDEEGNPNAWDVIATISLWIDTPLPFDQIAVKDYSENAGVADWLKAQRSPYLHEGEGETEMIPWVRKIGSRYSGFVVVDIYQVNEFTPLYELMKAGERESVA